MADLNKMLEEVKGMTVIELNDFVKMLETEFGVSAAAMATAAPAGAAVAAPVEEEKTEFNIVLTEVGPNKIGVIKIVRELTGLGLSEAKGIVDKAPATIKENVPKDQADDAAKKLKDIGAVVELK